MPETVPRALLPLNAPMYSWIPRDYSIADIERFTALSIRRGSPLASLAQRDPADLRVVAGAAALGLPRGEGLAQERVTAHLERFLAGPGDWLAASAQELLTAVRDAGFLEAAGDCWTAAIEPLPGVSEKRLEDDLEAAREILALRRARMKASLQTRNRTVNAPKGVAADPEVDRRCMTAALEEARAAAARGEVPVGAVVAAEGRIIARAGNETLALGDPTAHAEVLALRRAAAVRENHRLAGTTLYVTLEPCPMCAGAISEARCARIVYGAGDARRGALEGALRLFDLPGVNHRPVIEGGLMAAEGEALVRAFFAERRPRSEEVNASDAREKEN